MPILTMYLLNNLLLKGCNDQPAVYVILLTTESIHIM